MLTLESILKATRQAASYGETGKHYFDERGTPRVLGVTMRSDETESRPGLVREWDEGLKEFRWKEVS